MDEEILRGRGKRAGTAAVCCFFFSLNTRTKPRTAASHLSAVVAPHGS